MGVPIAPGYPNYSGTYTPTMFSADFLPELYAALCFGSIANTQTASILTQQGDKAIFPELPEVVVKDYIKGQKLSFDVADPKAQEMEVSRAKSFAVSLNRIDLAQTNLKLSPAVMAHAVKTLQQYIETDLFEDVWQDASPLNQGAGAGAKSANINMGTTAAPLLVTKDNILDILCDAAQVMDEANVPTDKGDLFVTLPPFATNLIKRSDLKNASITGDTTSPIRNGRIGQTIDVFNVYKSNCLWNVGGTYYCMFGTPSALAFVSQITETDIVKPTDEFATYLRGLSVYDAKILKALGIGLLVMKRG
jgi:hypothetical protein